MPADAGTQYAVSSRLDLGACDYWVIRLRG